MTWITILKHWWQYHVWDCSMIDYNYTQQSLSFSNSNQQANQQTLLADQPIRLCGSCENIKEWYHGQGQCAWAKNIYNYDTCREARVCNPHGMQWLSWLWNTLYLLFCNQHVTFRACHILDRSLTDVELSQLQAYHSFSSEIMFHQGPVVTLAAILPCSVVV